VIQLVNFVLTLVSLGLYWFWGRVRIRRYVLGQSEIEGDRFAYHGTGKELLIGFFKVTLLFGIPLALISTFLPALLGEAAAQTILVILGYAIGLFFWPYAMVSARRYRLSRTSWRGIRFSFRGPAGPFVRLFARGSILTTVTLGLYYPIFDVSRQHYLVSHSWFGSRRFWFDGEGSDLFRPFVVAVLLTIPTLGLSWFWYVARRRRYVWDHTGLDQARFRCTVRGGPLLLLWVVNAILIVITLGLARPWVRVRNIAFAFANLSLVGPVDLAAIQQEWSRVSATGEGLAGLFDSDTGFDFG